MAGSCEIVTGVLKDPYTGRAIRFRFGGASEVEIDHVVALSNAWQTGAQSWDKAARRERFANDPLNLLAVDGTAELAEGRRRRRHLAAYPRAVGLV